MGRPGPIGRSCLTCRNRRKKCDQTRPKCERCRIGDFECLGYDRDALLRGSSSGDSIESEVIQGGDISWGMSTQGAASATPIPPNSWDINAFNDSESVTTLFSSAYSEPPTYPSHYEVITQPRANLALPSIEPSLPHQLSPRAIELLVSLPPHVSCIPSDVMEITNIYTDQFGRLMSLSLFRLTHQQFVKMVATLTWRLCNLASTRCAMFVANKLFDSLTSGAPLTKAQVSAMLKSINRIEQYVLSASAQSLTAAEARVQVTSSLELGLLKLRISDLDSYTVLRTYASTFVQTVFSDSSLWSGSSTDSIAIPLARVLTSTQLETGNFVMLDMMCALTYGLPELVEYDTSIPPLDDEVHFSELVHGCPPRLRLIFSEINVLALWNQSGPIPDWRSLEEKLNEWQPTIRSMPAHDSLGMVAALAIQESWRHTLLIYLYMAACGASSDEPRVMVSVRQVFRMVDSIKVQHSRVTDVLFRVPLLIAGAFSPIERDRALARSKLLGGAGPRVWLLNVPCFVPVLDHLWHGAAANGSAIRWSDYVHSRRAVIPVEVQV